MVAGVQKKKGRIGVPPGALESEFSIVASHCEEPAAEFRL